MTGSRDGGTDSQGFTDGTDGASMFHVCCGLAQSTSKPVSCRFGPNLNSGSALMLKVIGAVEFVSLS